MAATMTKVANKAGVSVAVVSRLLRDDPTLRVSDATRRRVLQITRQLGGVQVRGAQANPTRRRRRRLTRTILMPINRIFDPALAVNLLARAELGRHIERVLSAERFRVQIGFFDSGEDENYITQIIDAGTHCDGLILLSGIANENIAKCLRESRYPHVTNDHYAERLEINTVRPHISEGLRRVIEHLLELGHRRIAYLGTPNSYRLPMLKAVMAASNMSLRPSLAYEYVVGVDGQGPEAAAPFAAEAFAGILDANKTLPFTALICDNDITALAVLDVMRQRGLEPGHDLSVVGVDNREVHGPDPVAEPILTTVDNPSGRIGRRMGELLINQILHNQNQIVHEQLPAPLIVRRSTGLPKKK